MHEYSQPRSQGFSAFNQEPPVLTQLKGENPENEVGEFPHTPGTPLDSPRTHESHRKQTSAVDNGRELEAKQDKESLKARLLRSDKWKTLP